PTPDSAPTVAVVAEKIDTTPAGNNSVAVPASALAPPMNLLEKQSRGTQIDFHPSPVMPKDELLNDAHLLLESGDNQAALGLYNQVLAQAPTSRAALSGKMYALQRTGQYEDAVVIGHKLLQLDPQDQNTRANLIAALSQSYAQSSMIELQQMVDANPDNATVRVALAHLLMRRGYVDQAFTQLSRAVQIVPGNLSYQLDLAILYDQAGHHIEALQLYRAVTLKAQEDDNQALKISTAALRQRMQYLETVIAANTTAP
ncbi:MAG TPA: tetratricopeptide repeat protein, partial [Alphaproteobacteria bacterium]|nr:tetratricopeptide repeat protein [Alphaproteobacteria bacterium]